MCARRRGQPRHEIAVNRPGLYSQGEQKSGRTRNPPPAEDPRAGRRSYGATRPGRYECAKKKYQTNIVTIAITTEIVMLVSSTVRGRRAFRSPLRLLSQTVRLRAGCPPVSRR